MNQILMWIIAAAAFLGGLDSLLGNRFGLGQRFDEGFRLIGPLISGMLGILCLTPVLAKTLSYTIAPLLGGLGLDPSILAGVIPIDMGGYQLALEITSDPKIGLFSAVIITATFGCTFVFTIPVGFGMMSKENRKDFILGIMYGLIFLPVSLIIGGLLCGLGILQTIWQSIPVLLLAFILAIGIWKRPVIMTKIFLIFAQIVRVVSTVGIIAGLVEYLTGISVIPGLMPFQDALLSAALCGILLIGCMPLAEIMNRLFRRPLHALGSAAGMDDQNVMGLLLSLVSVTASLGLMHDMSGNDTLINAAFLVCAAAVFGPHLGVCAANAPELIFPLVASKLAGGICAAFFAVVMLRRKRKQVA